MSTGDEGDGKFSSVRFPESLQAPGKGPQERKPVSRTSPTPPVSARPALHPARFRRGRSPPPPARTQPPAGPRAGGAPPTAARLLRPHQSCPDSQLCRQLFGSNSFSTPPPPKACVLSLSALQYSELLFTLRPTHREEFSCLGNSSNNTACFLFSKRTVPTPSN